MDQQLTIAEHQLLWMLVAHGGEAFENLLKPKPTKAQRDSLEGKGLINVEKRQKPTTGKRKTFANYLKISGSGWNRCNDELSWPLPRIKSKADLVLNWLMPRMKRTFDEGITPVSLSDFFNKTAPNDKTVEPLAVDSSAAGDILQKIRDAYQPFGAGRRIRIADVRQRLTDLSHDEVTRGLWSLAMSNEITLYPFDDPRQITSEDEAASVMSSTGVPQHILYFGGIAS